MTTDTFKLRLLSEMRRLAVDGRSPSRNRYNAQRAEDAPSASWAEKRTGMSWSALAALAGLTANPKHNRKDIDGEPANGFGAVLEQHIAAGATLAPHNDRYHSSLDAEDHPRRVERVTGRTVAGQPCIIHREYRMVR